MFDFKIFIEHLEARRKEEVRTMISQYLAGHDGNIDTIRYPYFMIYGLRAGGVSVGQILGRAVTIVGSSAFLFALMPTISVTFSLFLAAGLLNAGESVSGSRLLSSLDYLTWDRYQWRLVHFAAYYGDTELLTWLEGELDASLDALEEDPADCPNVDEIIRVRGYLDDWRARALDDIESSMAGDTREALKALEESRVAMTLMGMGELADRESAESLVAP